MVSLLSRWFRSRSRTVQNCATGRKRTTCKPLLEMLEDRVVPSTTVYFDDFAQTPAVDSSGNQYVTFSRLHGTVDLDPDPARTSLVTGFDYTDFGSTNGQFLVKYSPAHEVLWVKSAAAGELPGWLNGLKVAADPGGAEYLYAFGGAMTKMNLDGSVVWSHESVGVDTGVIDADGTIYGAGDGVVTRWSADGTLQWTTQEITASGTTADPSPAVWSGPIAVANGVVYFGGFYRGTLGLGGLTNDRIDSASTSPDGFLAAYDTDGNFQSVAHFIDAKVQFVRAVGSDVYLTAQFGYTADLDPGAGQKLLTPGNING